MSTQNRVKMKRRTSFREAIVLILTGVFAFVLAGSFSQRGIAQKWATAVIATVIVFGFVAYARRQSFLRWSFWASFSICFVIHVVLVVFLFRLVLSKIERFSILFWYPVMLIEVVILFVVIKKLEEKLTGKREIVKLSF